MLMLSSVQPQSMPHSYTHQKQLLSELGMSYPGIRLHRVGPHIQRNISTIEAVQRRAARYVTNNYSSYASISEMLTHLQWTLLNNLRESLKIIMLYKIIQQLVDVPKSNLISALDY